MTKPAIDVSNIQTLPTLAWQLPQTRCRWSRLCWPRRPSELRWRGVGRIMSTSWSQAKRRSRSYHSSPRWTRKWKLGLNSFADSDRIWSKTMYRLRLEQRNSSVVAKSFGILVNSAIPEGLCLINKRLRRSHFSGILVNSGIPSSVVLVVACIEKTC